MRESLARDLSEMGGELRCRSCQTTKELRRQNITRYLAAGWPECCGETMEWRTARQQAEDSNQPGASENTPETPDISPDTL